MPLAPTRSPAFRLTLALAAAALCLSLSSCAGWGHVYEQPRVRILGTDITNVSLQSADLVFDVAVENPNAFSFVLQTVSYRLRVNGEPFLDGHNDLRAQIAARGTSPVRLPVTLRLADVLRVLQALKGERHAGYDLDAEFRFDVPVVGERRVPVRRQGDFSLADIPFFH
jgi:LEA14-like dessication related protein